MENKITGWKANLSKYRQEDQERMFKLHNRRSHISFVIGVLKNIVKKIDKDIDSLRRLYEM